MRNSIRKRLLGLLLTLFMVLALLPVTPMALAASAFNPTQYSAGDIAVIDGIIAHNGLLWPTSAGYGGSSPPGNWMAAYWPGVVWDDSSGINRIVDLDLSSEDLTGTLNVSGLTAMESCNCFENNLTAANVSGCIALTHLTLWRNNLSSLNASSLTNLEYLDLDENGLTTQNVSGLANLETLYCSENNLTALNLTGLTALSYIDCRYNQMTDDSKVTGVAALSNFTSWDDNGFWFSPQGPYLYGDIAIVNGLIANNGLNWTPAVNGANVPGDWDVDFSADVPFARITRLNISGADVTGAVNLSGLTALTDLDCSSNSLTSLNINGCTALEALNCMFNRLTALDVTNCAALTALDCSVNSLTSLNVSNCTSLEVLHCTYNKLTALDVSALVNLTDLDCGYNSVPSLDVTHCTALDTLYCDVNALTALTLTGLSNLKELNCSSNMLTGLTDLTDCAALEDLICAANRLAGPNAFDVTGLANLDTIDCRYNYMDQTTPENDIVGFSAAVTTSFTDGGLPQNDPGFVAAIGIRNLPSSVQAGRNLTLTGVVFPSNATNKTISWDIIDQTPGTGATLTGSTLSAAAPGVVMLYATVTDGVSPGVDFMMPVIINVTPAVSYTGNTGSPSAPADDGEKDTGPTPTLPFKDVPSDSGYYDNILFVLEQGLMVGTSEDAFSPDRTLSRAMIATILYRAAGQPDVSYLAHPFSDVGEDEWYSDAVTWAAGCALINGYNNGNFGPDDPITRQDLAVMLDRYAQHKGMTFPETNAYTGFTDDADIANYARDAVVRFFRAGVITGYPDGSFRPLGTATRAQAAALLHRFLTSEGDVGE